MHDTYKSIPSPSEGVYRDNGSRFIAKAFPVETEEEAREIIESLRKEYHDARHHCFAYRLGLDGAVYRSNDDGEPSGSAGRPILGQIDSAGLSDVLIVVVRYFGGVKLGIPGLIRAYKTSASAALEAAGTIEKTASARYSVRFGYAVMNEVMKVVKDLELDRKDSGFGMECSMEVAVRLSREEAFLKRASAIEGCIVKKMQ